MIKIHPAERHWALSIGLNFAALSTAIVTATREL
jgi:hypothetical protein